MATYIVSYTYGAAGGDGSAATPFNTWAAYRAAHTPIAGDIVMMEGETTDQVLQNTNIAAGALNFLIVGCERTAPETYEITGKRFVLDGATTAAYRLNIQGTNTTAMHIESKRANAEAAFVAVDHVTLVDVYCHNSVKGVNFSNKLYGAMLGCSVIGGDDPLIGMGDGMLSNCEFIGYTGRVHFDGHVSKCIFAGATPDAGQAALESRGFRLRVYASIFDRISGSAIKQPGGNLDCYVYNSSITNNTIGIESGAGARVVSVGNYHYNNTNDTSGTVTEFDKKTLAADPYTNPASPNYDYSIKAAAANYYNRVGYPGINDSYDSAGPNPEIAAGGGGGTRSRTGTILGIKRGAY